MVDGGAAAHACQCQAVDFIGGPELNPPVADGDIAQHAAVVAVVVSSVFSEVVVGRNSFNLSGPSKIGGRIAQNDDAAPLAACVIGHRPIEWIPLKSENDGGCSGAVGHELSAFGDNQGRGVHATSRGPLDDCARFNGEGLSGFNKHIA